MLTIGISTVFGNLDRAESLVKSLTQSFENTDWGDAAEILVVVQGSDKVISTPLGAARYVFLKGLGLSVSRNQVIAAAKGRHIWFLDDDVAVDSQQLNKVVGTLFETQNDIHLGKIKCSDCTGYYKNYSRILSKFFGHYMRVP